MKKAVILAGGLSLRMKGSNKNTIKCLLPIDGEESIIGRTIRLLKKNGIQDIVLVVGYKSEELRNTFGNAVRYIEEPLYKKEGMLDSLCYALDEFDEPFLFMYADSVFSEKAIKKIVNSDKADIVCLISDKQVDDESEKIKIENGKIVRCSKKLGNNEADGEFTGIIKNTSKGAQIFKKYLSEMRDSGIIEHKNVRDLIEFMASKGVEIKDEKISGDGWMEIDFVDEYEFAKNDFIQKIKKREIKGGKKVELWLKRK